MIKNDQQLFYDSRAEVLKTLRLNEGFISIEEYADKVGIHKTTYKGYEDGKSISQVNLFKIMDLMKLQSIKKDRMAEFGLHTNSMDLQKFIALNQKHSGL